MYYRFIIVVSYELIEKLIKNLYVLPLFIVSLLSLIKFESIVLARLKVNYFHYSSKVTEKTNGLPPPKIYARRFYFIFFYKSKRKDVSILLYIDREGLKSLSITYKSVFKRQLIY